MFAYNIPDATGFSIRWKGRIKHMHTHLPEDDFAVYQGYDEEIWLHFPLDKGEIISEIWKQYDTRRNSATLIVSTLFSMPDLDTNLSKVQNKFRPHSRPRSSS